MPREFLTDKRLEKLKPAPAGKRYEIMDAGSPGLGVRVSDSGQKSFIMVARFGESKNPTRRWVADYTGEAGDDGSLALARQKAERWRKLLRQGIDPREQEAEQKQVKAKADAAAVATAELAKQGQFSSVTEAFLARPEFKKQRRAEQVAREIRRELLCASRNPWVDRLVSEIDDADIAVVVSAIRERPAPYQAYNVLGHVRAIFRWAKRPENRKRFGLVHSPLDSLQPRDFGLKKEPRQRVLSDLEIAAFWRAARKMGYPNGTAFQLLLVTGQRKSEISEASWAEISHNQQLLTIPAERFKSDAEHIVPLSALALDLLASLPRFTGKGAGDFLFSTQNGRAPINGFSNAKEDLDRRMLSALRAYARKTGQDVSKVKLDPFVLHDLRRTMRTKLSELRVPEHVAELVIGHAKKGLERIYNHHRYLPEMRQALDEWAARLRAIVEPAPLNVVKLRGRA